MAKKPQFSWFFCCDKDNNYFWRKEMKYLLSGIGLVSVLIAIFLFGGAKQNEEYVRLHIVANSSSMQDSKVKYDVKEAVLNYLSETVNAKNSQSFSEEINIHMRAIEKIAETELRKNRCYYGVCCTIEQEDFPTRAYGDLVLKEGVYQTIRIQLGSVKGDNWWCVAFPNVCDV